MLCARNGHSSVVAALLQVFCSSSRCHEFSPSNKPFLVLQPQGGANLESRSKDGITALHTAVEFNQLDVSRFLLERKGPLSLFPVLFRLFLTSCIFLL
jgi:ankyrin repeat protein